MSTPDSTSEYLLLFRGSGWVHALSPAELQEYGTSIKVRPIAAERPARLRARHAAREFAHSGV